MSDLFTRIPEDAITEPGIFDITHKRYLADPVIVPSLNASVAKLLVNQSPAHARAAHPRFNPEVEDDSTEAQDIGTAAHSIFLKGESMVELVDVKDWRTNAAKAAKAEIEGRGHIALKKDAYGAVHLMVSALERFREKTGAFTAGAAEQTLVWKDGPSWCRAKVDWLPDEPSAALWDLKTSSSAAIASKWTRNAYEMGTDFQAAWYCRGAECVRGEPPLGMNFAVIENKSPYAIAVFGFSSAGMEIANAKVKLALQRWEWCMEDNSWPSYPVEVQTIDPPPWIAREWEHLTFSGAAMRRQIADNADNLAGRIIEAGSFAG